MSSCEENEENSTQKEILKQFRKNLSDVLTSDVTDKVLLKWLRAKNFNLKKSEELYRVDCRVRAVFNVDGIETWEEPEIIQKYEFANHIGMARDGTPIHYVAMGRGDLKGFVMGLDVYNIGYYCLKILERDQKRCKEQSKKLGKEINDVTYIIDMANFSLRQAFFPGVTELGFDLFRMLQDHYPEIWKYILVVNAPIYFQTAYNFFKPIFRLTLLRKVHVVSRDGTANLLLKYIDAEVLPAFLGGKRVDSKGDSMCSEFMKFGGTVPEKYYLRNRTPLMPTDPDTEDVWLPPRSFHNAVVISRKANSIIRVEIRTEGGSIPATLLYRKFGPNPEHLDIPGRNEYLDPANERCNVEQCGPCVYLQTHVAPVDNRCFAPWPGIYIFKMDNSYNWLTSRRCIYRIRVVSPGEETNLK